MTDNAQALIREIETAQQSLQENLQQIYYKVHPKNILKKLSISIKNTIASPVFIGIVTIFTGIVISTVVLNKKRTHRLVKSQHNAQKTLDAYKELQSSYSE